MSEWEQVGPVKLDEQCVYCQAYVGPLGFAYQDGGMICQKCYRVHVLTTGAQREGTGGSAALSDTTVYGKSRLVYAAEHGLRAALHPEGRDTYYVLCCAVCGETRRLVPIASIPVRCAVCGTAWDLAAPTFWVLVPKEKEGS